MVCAWLSKDRAGIRRDHALTALGYSRENVAVINDVIDSWTILAATARVPTGIRNTIAGDF